MALASSLRPALATGNTSFSTCSDTVLKIFVYNVKNAHIFFKTLWDQKH